MKTKFLKEKRAFEEATEARIRAMADSANKVTFTPQYHNATSTYIIVLAKSIIM